MPDVQPLPPLFILKSNGETYRNQFSKGENGKRSKKAALEAIPALTDRKFRFKFKWKVFKEIMTAVSNYDQLRIHFVITGPCSGLNPQLTGEHILLLFSPEITGSKKQRFFLIREDADHAEEVPPECATQWRINWEKYAQRELRTTIDNDPDNEEPCKPGTFSDSRSILFEKELWEKTFLSEFDYQIDMHQNRITAIGAEFGAYPPSGKQPGPLDPKAKPKFKNRLMLQFEYCNTELQQTFYITDQKDYEERKKLSEQDAEQKLLDGEVNNGQLCPTYCPEEDPTDG